MEVKRSTTREELREAGVPSLLIDEAMGYAALGLDRPVPTEELVAKTMARLRETLNDVPLPMREPVPMLPPLVVTGRQEPIAWAQFLGTLSASVLDEALPFATAHPDQSAIVVVDNHEVVDPEAWDVDLQLTMLRGTYRTAEETLARVQQHPICRLVVLKDTPGAYDDRDLAAIRRAIARPTIASTYLVSHRRARALQGRSYTVVGREVVFELAPKVQAGGQLVTEPSGIRDPERVSTVRDVVTALQASAVELYANGRLNERFEWALKSESNDRLRDVLTEMIG